MDPIVQASLVSSIGLVVTATVTGVTGYFARRKEDDYGDELRKQIRLDRLIDEARGPGHPRRTTEEAAEHDGD